MQTKILDTIENGIIITNQNLDIILWNRWLAIHTGIPSDKTPGNTLEDLFPRISFDLLKQKIRIALRMKSSTFTNARVLKFVIPIEQNKITKSIFKHMRQNVVITPLNEKEVSINIYDVSSLLEAQTIIDDQMKLLEKQAKTDSLTGCFNKNMFNELLTAEIKRSIRHNHIFSLIIFDIDNFKSVNDTYGHLKGDSVLKKLANLSRKNIRKSDMLARWGGEEFCILLPETPLNGAAILADNVRQKIASHDFGSTGLQQCSFGVAEYTLGTDENIIIANADKALYYAKNNGKNQVAIFKDETSVSWQP
ncbi:MAG: diguanylate cyclase [Desulfobacterales bacterium]|nr:diguanylate cyclase [Desulfobacterales bacterium]MBU8909685.1 diguanylate cyclase [Desulfobacterales bacterium]